MGADGLQEYSKLVAILPSLPEATVNREFLDATIPAQVQKDSAEILQQSPGQSNEAPPAPIRGPKCLSEEDEVGG